MKTVILSFDDSLLDFYTNVFPLLKEFDVKSTLNVINSFVNIVGGICTDVYDDR